MLGLRSPEVLTNSGMKEWLRLWGSDTIDAFVLDNRAERMGFGYLEKWDEGGDGYSGR